MLVVISDLHLQQTDFDSIRYRRDGKVRQMGVHRNVKASAVERLFHQVGETAAHRGSTEVHLVFAGDIFELHRTPLWFFGPHNDVRPTDPAGPDHPANRLRARVVEILDALAAEHAEVWQAIAQGVTQLRTAGLPVTVRYLPGNHDRLANAWPTVRQKVRALLAMDATQTDPFPVRLDFTPDGLADYGVRVRHGHEYDPPNFAHSTAKKTALDLEWNAYLDPAFGDYVTVDVATRLALAFRARYGVAMRLTTGSPADLQLAEDLRELYLDLNEFDDVRPASLLADYLATHMGANQKKTFELLKPLLRDVVETAVADPFFSRNAGAHIPKLLLKLLPELLKNLPPSLIEKFIRDFSRQSDDASNPPARRAAEEFQLGGGVSLVVAGHTHRPEQVPLPSTDSGPPALYLNSGTWRTTIPFGIDTFGRLRAYTMVFCYNRAERERESGDGRSFETWTGHLAADSIGPYDEEARRLAPPTTPATRLQFTSLRVNAIQKEADGAELKVQFGVDGEGREAAWTKVKPGMTLSIDTPAVPLDPDLDGEVWFYGVEVDWGDCPLDYDDPLPWALEPLARVALRAAFRPGDFEVLIRSRDRSGKDYAEFVLSYRVEPASA